MRGYARLVHPFPSLLVAALTAALIPMADRQAGLSLYLQLGFGMLAYQFSIGAANDAADAALDAVTKPAKPIPSGRVTARSAARVAAALAAAGMVATAGLPLGPWLIGVAGLTCGLAHDLHFKRSRLSWLPWAIAFPLIPIWVWTAAGVWDGLLWWDIPLGMLLGVAVYFANQSADAAGDRRAGVAGAAQRIGQRKAARVALASFGAAASAAAVVLVVSGEPGRAGIVAVTAAIAVMLLPRAARTFGRDGVFGVMATSAAAIALAFLSAAAGA